MKTIEERVEELAESLAGFSLRKSVIKERLSQFAADLQAEKEKELEQVAFSDGLELRGIIRQIGEMFSETAKTSDDGSVQEDVLALKAPDSSMSESQTPRTDAAERDQEDRAEYRGYLVPARFARELESELTATRARLAELEGIAERLGRAVDVSLKAMETAYERSFTGMLRGFMGVKIDEVKAILAYKGKP